MNKAYLLIVCLLSASFTGCIEDEVEDNTEEILDTDDDNTDSNNNNQNVTDDNDDGGAKWTFMTYISDSDLEYFSIEDMVEMERVGSTDKVHIVVQIDRWDGYDMPDRNDDSNGDWETAKRYLITKENKGDHVIGSTEIEDIGEINTGDPDELVEFVKWAQANYPAEHYALNIWNHGSGATGVAYEQSCPDYCWEYGNEADKLELSEIDAALNEITNNGENKLDIVGFDACLMATIEVVEAVAPYSDIMIGSEILEPGDGWDYSFLQLLVDNPATTPEQLGAKIVDTFVAQGQTSDQSYALTMLDMSIAEDTMNAINALAELKDSTSLISDLEEIRYSSVHVEPGDSSSAVDLLHLLTSLSEYTTDSKVKIAADRAAINVSAMILKAEFNGDPSDIDTTGMTGVSILFPNLENEWTTRSKGVSEDSGWGELMDDYYAEQEEEQVLFFNESSLIYDTDDLDQDGRNDSISLALEIESLSDGVFGNLTLDVFNNRGYWIDGIEYDFVMNSDEVVYIDIWDVYYIHMLEDGESDLLRIEAVLSLVEEDGTHTLQDWVETPYEYLTAFNESRELLLTEYVYFTFNQTIEPVIGDDSAFIEVTGSSGSTIVSNWSVENTDFPVDIYFDRINLWWGSAGDAQSYCQWTFVFYINGESVEQYYASCEMYGYEPNRETFIIDEEIRVLAGDIFEVEIFYEGEEDIYFFYNSEEFDTGLEVSFSMPDE
ncbi:MAG: clostripain-related cysteine peptidase [Candidatus Poseidoniia archaeon]|nr:clostripain-related cysteine peptidase [Candidatus Poseidoniia archaeon]